MSITLAVPSNLCKLPLFCAEGSYPDPMLLLFQCFLVCFSFAKLPQLPLLDGRLDRSIVKKGMIEQMYGLWPSESLSATQAPFERELLSGLGSYTEWQLSSPKDPSKKLSVGMFIPKGIKRPVTLLMLNKCGNHSLLSDPQIPLGSKLFQHPKHCKGVGRGSHSSKYEVEYLLTKGIAVATFAEADIDADSPRIFGEGIKDLYPHSWGTISSWAWGLSEAANYLKSTGITGEIFTTGHSRRGKAGLVAAALNESIAGTFPHQSGLGGTASLRHTQFRESAQMITNGGWWYPLMGEPDGLIHFFHPNFMALSKTPEKLPYDAHFLIGMVAPRILIDFQGTKDFWAGPKSSLRMLKAASFLWNETTVPNWEYEYLPQSVPDIAQVTFPWNHKQDIEFWKVLVTILQKKGF